MTINTKKLFYLLDKYILINKSEITLKKKLFLYALWAYISSTFKTQGKQGHTGVAETKEQQEKYISIELKLFYKYSWLSICFAKNIKKINKYAHTHTYIHRNAYFFKYKKIF